MTAYDDTEEDKPLDPAVERVRRKMLRLMVVSVGIMMVGLMAVLGAIVYKFSGRSETAPRESLSAGSAGVPITPGFEGRIDLPDGSEIVSSSLDGGNILLRVRHAEEGERLLVYSLGEDRIIATVTID